ncbi:hypothetical protein MBLNU230_g2051t1 [Neophaeotheca triangularis]
MASGQRPERQYAQDYLARIRYSNALPPPPLPPKLLEIPGTGLADGQYTSASYGSKMAREQPVNIEGDAELGMPLDLLGLPGVFNGDESAIMGDLQPISSLHPDDQALMIPLDKIGKTQQKESSFLRRTEYVSSQQPHIYQSSTSKDLLRLKEDAHKRKAAADQDNPINILRHQNKGFDIAYPEDAYQGEDTLQNVRSTKPTAEEINAWKNPKHPSDPSLQLLDSYPILPDLDALPSLGTFIVAKLNSNPINAPGYDERLNCAILRPLQNPETEALYKQKMDEWDPASGKPQPLPVFDYDYYLPDDLAAVESLNHALNYNDPDGNDPEMYTDTLPDGSKVFKFSRKRTYETFNQIGDPNDFYNKQVAVALHDGDDSTGRLQKAAYIYPIAQRTTIRPKRNVGMSQQNQPEIEHIDELNVTVGEMTEQERAMVQDVKDSFMVDNNN